MTIVNAKRDVHQTITDKIIQQLESGVRPWMRPWDSGQAAVRPLRSTGQPYSGINVLSLWADACDKGFTSPYWFGFQTALKMGAHVRKGEKGSQIVYSNKLIKTEINDDGEEKSRAVPFLKSSIVFNAAQIDGLPEHFYRAAEPVAPRNPGQCDGRAG